MLNPLLTGNDYIIRVSGGFAPATPKKGTRMSWLSPNPRPFQTALAMVGAKPGLQVLVLGAGDGKVAAAIAQVTGLNGRTLVIDPSGDAQAAVERAAAEAGALVEFQQAAPDRLPDDLGGFDIVVLHQRLSVAGNDPAPVIAEAVRVLRPGGRVVVIEGAMQTGWRDRLKAPRQAKIQGDVIERLLTTAGLRASRLLAETDGVTYAEGAKPRDPGAVARGPGTVD
jgi:ArsR family transcriptional regulator